MTMETIKEIENKQEMKSVYRLTEINEPWYFTRS